MGTFVLNQIPIQEVTVTYTGSGDGDFTCKDSIRSEQTCPEGEVVKGFRSDGSVVCENSVKSKTCPQGDVVIGIKPDGSMICGSPIGGSRESKKECPLKQMQPRRNLDNPINCIIGPARHGDVKRGNCTAPKGDWRPGYSKGYCEFQCLNGTWLKIKWECATEWRKRHHRLPISY